MEAGGIDTVWGAEEGAGGTDGGFEGVSGEGVAGVLDGDALAGGYAGGGVAGDYGALAECVATVEGVVGVGGGTDEVVEAGCFELGRRSCCCDGEEGEG